MFFILELTFDTVKYPLPKSLEELQIDVGCTTTTIRGHIQANIATAKFLCKLFGMLNILLRIKIGAILKAC